jgi:hypothetical protein
MILILEVFVSGDNKFKFELKVLFREFFFSKSQHEVTRKFIRAKTPSTFFNLGGTKKGQLKIEFIKIHNKNI